MLGRFPAPSTALIESPFTFLAGLVVLPRSTSERGSRWLWGWELWTGVGSAVPRMWQVICLLHNTRVNLSSRAPCAGLLPLQGWSVFPGTPKLPHFPWDWGLSPQLVTPQSIAIPQGCHCPQPTRTPQFQSCRKHL